MICHSTVTRTASKTTILLLAIILAQAVLAATVFAAKFPCGTQNGGMDWDPGFEHIDQIYAEINADLPGNPYVRIDMENNNPSGDIPNFVRCVIDAHKYGMKVIALCTLAISDYPPGSTYRFPYPMNQARPELLRGRIQAYLDALKSAGQSVEVFEIGNELDNHGFNASVPQGNAQNTDLGAWQHAYASYLSTAIDTIKSSENSRYFSGAKIVTVGFANNNGQDNADFLPDPEKQLAAVLTILGPRYRAKIDGYGCHNYFPANNWKVVTGQVFRAYVTNGLTDKPLYITEWGFRKSGPYTEQRDPTYAPGETRADLELKWLNYVAEFPGIRVAAATVFDFDMDSPEKGTYDIFDGPTLRHDEAAAFVRWNRSVATAERLKSRRRKVAGL